jgi:D-aspartate ligase
VVSAARSAGARGRAVHVLPESPGLPPAAASRHVSTVLRLAPGDRPEAAWERRLAALPPAVLVPCSDRGIAFLARRRHELLELGHHPAEGDDDLWLAALDKQRTYALADAAGVPRPRTVPVTSRRAAVEAGHALGWPCGAKPRSPADFRRLGLAGKGWTLPGPAAVDELLGPAITAGAELLMTEVVPGPDDAYCSYYGYVDARGRELLHVTKRKLRQFPVHFGTGTYHVTDDVPDARDLGRRFVRGSGLRGLVNVEFKRDARDGRLVLIECNVRLTAAVELLRRVGVDLPELVYQGALGQAEPVPRARPQAVHQWLPLQDLRALRQYRAAGELDVATWARSLRGRQSLPMLRWSDPGPSAVHAVQVAWRVAARARRVA